MPSAIIGPNTMPAQAQIFPQNIPAELKQVSSWCNWRYTLVDGTWKKPPIRSIDGKPLSVTNPLDCQSFDVAMNAAETNHVGLGFCFSGNGLAGIDLDNPQGNPIIIQRHQAILATMNSYVEASPSGLGVHIIVKATLPGPGRRRDKIEVYSASRFFTMTGNVYYNLPIAERQTETVALWQSLGGTERAQSPTVENGLSRPEHTDDARIVEMAGNAKYGARFQKLWLGDWRSLNWYPSQSEADQGLVMILAYYSGNFDQTKRLFMASGLGARLRLNPKLKKADYVDEMVNYAVAEYSPRFEMETWADALKHDALKTQAPDAAPFFDARKVPPR